ncbi:MAG TPA: hypothetical protein VMN39_04470 [Longimicrobiaceae bacterium]|nr:hypothetical protein [Longimicrobiaceae bacterium]
MTPQRLTSVDDARLRDLEHNVVALSNLELAGDVADPRLRRYLDLLPPRAAAELIGAMLQMRHALDRASNVLRSAGYTIEAFCALDETERGSGMWKAVREAGDGTGQGPKYFLRYTRGARTRVRAYPTREEAIEAAITALEDCDGYPEAILLENGTTVLSCADLLRMWEDRHDPG